MKNLKTLGIAGGLIAAALVGGTLISVVSAAPSGSTGANPAAGTEVDTARYCQLWKETFAKKLGVLVDALGPAAKAASIATIDAAVAAGDLTADIAARMKARIDAADATGCGLLGGAFHGIGRGAAKAELGADLLDAAASALGMDKAALMTALRSGDSLQKITSDQGKVYADVSKAVHDAAKANVDALVTAGKLTQAREDAILAQLDKALASGEFPRHGRWHRFGPGHDGPDGSPDVPPAT